MCSAKDKIGKVLLKKKNKTLVLTPCSEILLVYEPEY